VVDNGLYLAVPLQMANGDAGQAAIDLEALDEDALGDEAEGGESAHVLSDSTNNTAPK